MAQTHEELALSWQGENVDPVAVERALTRMLRQLDPPLQDGDDHPPARASVLSLIACAASGDQEARAVEALGQLSERHPSRALSVVVNPEAPESRLDAWATVHCLLHRPSSALVCFEQVRLAAYGAAARHLSSVVSPLLIPDLPVYLWWLGEPPRPQEDLLGLCDRLIVDTRGSGMAGLVKVGDLVEAGSDHMAVIDLAWSALFPWREILASLFDPPETRAYQRCLRSVNIDYVAGMLSSRPLLLLCWLAFALGWTPASSLEKDQDGDFVLGFVAGGERRSAKLRGVAGKPGAQPGDLVGVLLEGGCDGDTATFAIARGEDGSSATLCSALPDGRETTRVVRFNEPSLAALLSRELERLRADPYYYGSLSLADQIVRPTVAAD